MEDSRSEATGTVRSRRKLGMRTKLVVVCMSVALCPLLIVLALGLYESILEETAMDLVVEDGSRVGCVYFLMSEENVKNHLRDFLNDTYYKGRHLLNTKGKTDLVLHEDNTAKSKVSVLFEVKRPKNSAESRSV